MTILIIRINSAARIGINMVIVAPSLCSPHGNWLKIGISGGRFPYDIKTKITAVIIRNPFIE